MRKEDKGEPINITDEFREEVILYWRFEMNNTTRDLVNHFQVRESVINSIIDKHIRNITKKFKNENR